MDYFKGVSGCLHDLYLHMLYHTYNAISCNCTWPMCCRRDPVTASRKRIGDWRGGTAGAWPLCLPSYVPTPKQPVALSAPCPTTISGSLRSVGYLAPQAAHPLSRARTGRGRPTPIARLRLPRLCSPRAAPPRADKAGSLARLHLRQRFLSPLRQLAGAIPPFQA